MICIQLPFPSFKAMQYKKFLKAERSQRSNCHTGTVLTLLCYFLVKKYLNVARITIISILTWYTDIDGFITVMIFILYVLMTNNNYNSSLLKRIDLVCSRKCLQILKLLFEMVELILWCDMLHRIWNDTCLSKSYSK